MNRGHKQTDLIVMDNAKAFDKVPRKMLLYKLDIYGNRGSTHIWLSQKWYRWPSLRSSLVSLKDGSWDRSYF